MIIGSARNQFVQYAASLAEKKARDASGAFVIEGRRFVDEVPADWPVEFVLVSESFARWHDTAAYEGRYEVRYASDAAFAKASGTVTPQGILAVCKIVENSAWLEGILNKGAAPLLLLVDRCADPGNVGSLLRSADAAGADGIVLSEGCADAYAPKALRAAAGSIFHVPVMSNAYMTDAIRRLRKSGVGVYGSSLSGAATPYGLNLTEPCAFVVGSEARGLGPDVEAACEALVKLPMRGKAESLNAAVAGGILLYEAARQRLEGSD